MNITLYKNTSSKNVVSKTLTQIKTITCNAYESIDIMSSVLIIDIFSDLTGCNYLFNAKFGRFYFINNIEMIDGNRARVTCSIDVLESWGSEIRANSGIVSRQKNAANFYLNDDQYVLENRTQTVTKVFPSSIFDANADCFILKVVGG